MAEILNITPSAVYRSNDSDWAAEDYRVGFNSGNTWRSKIDIPVGAFSGVSTKLVVKLTVDRTSYPGGAYGVLTANGNLTGDQVISSAVVGGYYNAPHADLLADAIAQSYAYTDENGSTRVSTSSVSSGYTFYFVFDTSALKPNTTYYVYSMRNVDSGVSITAWTVAKLGDISATLSYNASFTVTERHYLKDAEGELTQFDSTITKTVDVGGSYTPTLKTPPKGNTNKGATFAAYSTDWNRVGGGVPGVDYITVNENIIAEVYYPYAPPGSFVYYNDNGTAVKCEVYYNNNGTAVRCDAYYNDNGTAVKM